jgi:hypothetical protein
MTAGQAAAFIHLLRPSPGRPVNTSTDGDVIQTEILPRLKRPPGDADRLVDERPVAATSEEGWLDRRRTRTDAEWGRI